MSSKTQALVCATACLCVGFTRCELSERIRIQLMNLILYRFTVRSAAHEAERRRSWSRETREANSVPWIAARAESRLVSHFGQTDYMFVETVCPFVGVLNSYVYVQSYNFKSVLRSIIWWHKYINVCVWSL